MMSEMTRQRLQTVFQTIFEDPSLVLSEDQTADTIEKWDSMTNTLMIDAVEKEFGVKFSFRDVVNLKNVGDLARLIEHKLQHS